MYIYIFISIQIYIYIYIILARDPKHCDGWKWEKDTVSWEHTYESTHMRAQRRAYIGGHIGIQIWEHIGAHIWEHIYESPHIWAQRSTRMRAHRGEHRGEHRGAHIVEHTYESTHMRAHIGAHIWEHTHEVPRLHTRCASLRSWKPHGHVKKTILNILYGHWQEKCRTPSPGTPVLCEPAQLKRTWTCQKSHFVR